MSHANDRLRRLTSTPAADSAAMPLIADVVVLGTSLASLTGWVPRMPGRFRFHAGVDEC